MLTFDASSWSSQNLSEFEKLICTKKTEMWKSKVYICLQLGIGKQYWLGLVNNNCLNEETLSDNVFIIITKGVVLLHLGPGFQCDTQDNWFLLELQRYVS